MDHTFPLFCTCTVSHSSLSDYLFTALQTHVIGQDEALRAISFKLCGHMAKQNPKRPLSLLLYGPTGVGKSELAKSVSTVLNQFTEGAPWQTAWTELNTFTEAHSIHRLTGAPPGYVGYGDPSVLESVRRHPYTVFVFDELDKAHPNLLTVFMSILDEGRCTTQREDEYGNRELDFRRCIFLFTCNTDLSAPHSIGFSPDSHTDTVNHTNHLPAQLSLAHRLFLQDEHARQALVRTGVLKEIAGRFQGFIPFSPLSAQSMQKITAHQIIALGQEHGLKIISVSPVLIAALTPSNSFSARSGRNLLEGLLTPLFSACAEQYSSHRPLVLCGTPHHPIFLPLSGT